MKKTLVMILSLGLAASGTLMARHGRPEDRPRTEKQEKPQKPEKPEKPEKRG